MVAALAVLSTTVSFVRFAYSGKILTTCNRRERRIINLIGHYIVHVFLCENCGGGGGGGSGAPERLTML